MTVRTRLILTFAAVGALLVIPALFAVQRLTDLRDLAVEERGRQADASVAVGRIEAGLTELDRDLRSFLVTSSPIRLDAPAGSVPGGEGAEPWRGVEARLEDLLGQLDRVREAGYEEAVPPLSASLERVDSDVRRIGDLVEAGELATATELVPAFDRAVAAARDDLDVVADAIDSRAEGDFERAREISVSARRNTVVAVAVAVALTALLAAWTTGALTMPLQRLRTATARVADGHFETPPDLPYDREDEIGDLATSFRVMTRNLAELDRLKAEFMGVASHELKTPINVIRGYTELIEEELAGELTEQQREILGRIDEQTKVLTRQVSRLMDISRLETGGYDLELESVLVEDLLLALRRAYEILADEKGVVLVTEAAPDTPERIVVDVDLIRDEVLGNLVSNALKFTPEGGRVEVRASGGDGEVVFEVSDSGPGIPPQHREHIFEKYYKGDRSRAVGSGLGLAIAKEMVEGHAGSIGLVAHDGTGATFRVRLPVDGPPADGPAEPHEERGLEDEAARSVPPVRRSPSGEG